MDQATIRRHLDALAQADAELRDGLDRVGYPLPRIREPGFETLLAIVVGQQISTAAAAAIMSRLRTLAPRLEPQAVLALPDGALRDAGLSIRKVEYVTDLADAIVGGDFDPRRLAALDDAAAIEAITQLRGFGVWSAEIYLMFCLGREDVFPAGDLALRVGLQRLRRRDAALDERAARELAAGWAPYRSAASLFLWHYYRGAPA